MAEQLLIGLLFATIVSCSSFFAKFLTLSGSVAQCVLGFILLGFGGLQWTVPMLAFFLFSSLISRLGKQRRSGAESYFEKSSCRDAWQVMANGGIAGAIVLIWFFTKTESLYAAYLGSIAAATADTWGTEIGTLSRTSPVLVTTFKKAEAGRSGAISVLGSFAGFVGSFTIWLSSLPWLSHNDYIITLSTTLLGGFVGSLADSFVGATLQSQYRCIGCNKLTERSIHCEQQTLMVSGLRWMKNDHVNLICTLIGSAVSLCLFQILP